MSTTFLGVAIETLPRTLVVDPPLTDDEFEALCLDSGCVQLERTREGAILMNPPTGWFTGNGNLEVLRQLGNWAVDHGKGRAFDSNTAFRLPDSSILSPDAAYVLPAKLKGLTKADLERSPRLSPDFVIELLSRTDGLAKAKRKMERWVENGVAVGWLLNPYKRNVHIYHPGVEVAAASGRYLKGTGPVKGFTLDLKRVWRCYEV